MESLSSDDFPTDYSVSVARQVARDQRGLASPSRGGGGSHVSAFDYERIRDEGQLGQGSLLPSGSATASAVSTPSRARTLSPTPTPLLSSTSGSILSVSGLPLSPQDESGMSEQQKAVRAWGWRVKICFALHMIGALCLLHSYYWFTTVIGVVLLIGLGIYAYSIKQQTTNFVLLYVSIVLVNLLKNVLILYFFFTDVRHGHRLDTYEYFLAILLCVDVVLLTPTSLYSCFFLHRSISLTNLTF